MPMRVGDVPEGGAPPGPVPGAGETPATDDPAAAKHKKGGDDGVVGDAVEAAGWGCAIFECLDCASALAIGTVTAVVVLRRSHRRRRGSAGTG